MTNEKWKYDFWQAVMDTGYLMEGENRDYERRAIKALAESLNEKLEAHPEVSSNENFAMEAVAELVNALAENIARAELALA